MENKINYDKVMKLELDRIAKLDHKPKLLIHVCCGPCSTYPLIFLSDYFDVSIYYSNSNIYPKSEYDLRLNELKRYVNELAKISGILIPIIEPKYDNETYNLDLEQYASEPEGLTRCHICYEKRIRDTFCFAKENGFDYVTTVMTISRQKPSQVINIIGEKLEQEFVTPKYLFSDFKKSKGIDIGRELRIKYNLYQQDYCGCKYTYRKKLKKLECLDLPK